MPDTPAGLRHVEHVMGTVFSFDIRDRPDPGHPAGAGRSRTPAPPGGRRVLPLPGRQPHQPARPGRDGLDDCPPEVHEVLALCARAEPRERRLLQRVARRLPRPVRTRQRMGHRGGGPAAARGGGAPHLRQRRRRPRSISGRAAPGAPWRVGIAHPLRPGALATIVTAHHDLAVATSGTAERGAHIVDPHRGARHRARLPHRRRPQPDLDRHLRHGRLRPGARPPGPGPGPTAHTRSSW